jgi:WD40 repeat protein
MLEWTKEGSLREWDVPGARVVRETAIDQPAKYFWCLAWSADGKTVAGGVEQSQGNISWWNTTTGEKLGQVHAHPPYTYKLAFSQDGKVLASSGGFDGAIHLWDVATGAKVSPQGGHQEGITSLSVAADGKTVATVGNDNTLRFWDTATGAELRRMRTNGNAVAYSPDGKALAASRSYVDRSFPLLDAATGATLCQFSIGPMTQILSLSLSSDGTKLVAGGHGKATYLWDTATGQVLREFRGSDIWSSAFSADGTTLAVAAGGSLEVWDLQRDTLVSQFGPANALRGYSSLSFSPDSKLLLAAEGFESHWDHHPLPFDGSLRLYDVAKGKERSVLSGHRGPVLSAQFSPDGNLIASGGEDRTVRLWSVRTGKEVHRFEGHRGAVTAVAFTPDGHALISGSRDSTALVWDVTLMRDR